MSKSPAAASDVPGFENTPEFQISDSETAHLNGERFKTYEDMLNYFASSRSMRSEPPPAQFADTKGRLNLYRTFNSANETELNFQRREQWNPISQRPVMTRVRVNHDHIDSEFFLIQKLIFAYVNAFHEMTHVMSWEPFFTGRFNPTETDAFVEFSALSEGYAFFDADIVVSAAIRERFPDAELVFGRRGVSQDQFHPYRAFKAMGVKSLKQICDIYLDAFTGKESALSKADNNFSKALKERVRIFYTGGALRTLPPMHFLLTTFDIFSDFYERFCAKKNIPSLFSESFYNVLKTKGAKAHYMALFEDAPRELEALDEDTIARIRCRRAIQTRAYYAYQVKKILDAGWYTPKIQDAETEKAVKSVEKYIDVLEQAMDSLCQSKNADAAVKLIEGADEAYEKNVRSWFESRNMWVAERQELEPPKYFKGFSVSVNPEKPKTAEYITKACSHVAEILCNKIYNFTKPGQFVPHNMQGQRVINLKEAVDAVRRLTQIMWTVEQNPDDKGAREEFSKVMQMREALEVWSIPLWKMDPKGNQFEEFLFSYE